MNKYPRGSEWRKWDLHVHAPGTKLNDCYAKKAGELDLDSFCKVIHESDVAVLAIADYFTLGSFFAVKRKYVELYPDDDVLLLPNLELRLPFAVNKDGQEINLHLIFNPTITEAAAAKFLGHLKTSATTGRNRASVTCADLSSRQDYEGATVSIDAIDEAIKATFGEHAAVPSTRQQHLLVVASAKGDGVRPGGNGIQRKKLLTDEVDKYSDGFFANAGSRDYFLGVDRLESDERIAPKPVFDGCDAHAFDDLSKGLGKPVTTDGCQRSITWVKADPTYEGLLQTLIEPEERVAVQVSRPDHKEPYRVVSKVRFVDSEDFPPEVFFNPNLNAIIGSRSSGKSTLLAYIAHSVDPIETVRLQNGAAAGLRDKANAGPAAGFSWDDASTATCEVDWASGENTNGRVIYIPQNSLYALSEQPEEITKQIAPALFRTYPSVKTAYDSAMSKVAGANAEIRTTIEEWFGLADRIERRVQELMDLGDKTAITAERDRLQTEINRIKASAELTDLEVSRYQEIARQLDDKAARLSLDPPTLFRR